MDVLRDTNRVIDGLAQSDAVKAVLKRAAAWDREQRYPDAGAFCESLRLASSDNAARPGARLPQVGSKRPRLLRFLVVGAVIAGIVAAGGFGTYFGYIKPKRIHDEDMAALARRDAELTRLKAEYDEYNAKIDKLIQQLVEAKDEGTRLRLEKELEAAKRRVNDVNKRAGGSFSRPCKCTPNDPLCSCL